MSLYGTYFAGLGRYLKSLSERIECWERLWGSCGDNSSPLGPGRRLREIMCNDADLQRYIIHREAR